MDPWGKLQALSKWGVILSALGPYLTWDLQPSVREHIHHCRCCQNSIKWWQDWSRSHRWTVSGCCCSWHVSHSPFKCVTCYVTRESLYYFWEKFLGFDIGCFDCILIKHARERESDLSFPDALGTRYGKVAFPLFLWCCKPAKTALEISRVPQSQRCSNSEHCCSGAFRLNRICNLTISRRHF